jgi:uncharacterized protein
LIAIDTGFLVALLDKRDAWHARAWDMRDTASVGWITTWPVLTECCHLLQRALGTDYVVGLMEDVASGGLQVWQLPEAQLARIPQLMRKYASLPMDLADASLLLLAEHLGHGQILSTDLRDFGAYRWKNRKPFKNLLEAA